MLSKPLLLQSLLQSTLKVFSTTLHTTIAGAHIRSPLPTSRMHAACVEIHYHTRTLHKQPVALLAAPYALRAQRSSRPTAPIRPTVPHMPLCTLSLSHAQRFDSSKVTNQTYCQNLSFDPTAIGRRNLVRAPCAVFSMRRLDLARTVIGSYN